MDIPGRHQWPDRNGYCAANIKQVSALNFISWNDSKSIVHDIIPNAVSAGSDEIDVPRVLEELQLNHTAWADCQQPHAKNYLVWMMKQLFRRGQRPVVNLQSIVHVVWNCLNECWSFAKYLCIPTTTMIYMPSTVLLVVLAVLAAAASFVLTRRKLFVKSSQCCDDVVVVSMVPAATPASRKKKESLKMTRMVDRKKWKSLFLMGLCVIETMLPVLGALSQQQQQTRRKLTADQFEVVSGSCTTSGTCFESPNYPSNYGDDETCSIKVLSVGSGEKLVSVAFNTELFEDRLTIGETDYSGTTGPVGVAVSADEVMTWSSNYKYDSGGTESGFQVCLRLSCAGTKRAISNSGPCFCGGTKCTVASGLFCYARGSQCSSSAVTICSIQDGSATNSASCSCGSKAECTSASGLFCYAPLNLCRQTNAIIPVPVSGLGLDEFGNIIRSSAIAKVVDDWIDEDNKGTRSSIELIYGLIQDWDTSDVTSMADLFYLKQEFNADLSKWNVSQVTNMRESTFQLPLFNSLSTICFHFLPLSLLEFFFFSISKELILIAFSRCSHSTFYSHSILNLCSVYASS